jgi:hypothetical protein
MTIVIFLELEHPDKDVEAGVYRALDGMHEQGRAFVEAVLGIEAVESHLVNMEISKDEEWVSSWTPETMVDWMSF